MRREDSTSSDDVALSVVNEVNASVEASHQGEAGTPFSVNQDQEYPTSVHP